MARWQDQATHHRQIENHSQAAVIEVLIRELEEDFLTRRAVESAPGEAAVERAFTWREKLWVVPFETRIGTVELAEALRRPKSWVYARTQANAKSKIPHRRLDGFLHFVVGEIRDWIQAREEVFPAQGLEEVA